MIVIFLDLLTLPVYTRKVEITSLYAQWLAVIYKIRNQPVINYNPPVRAQTPTSDTFHFYF